MYVGYKSLAWSLTRNVGVSLLRLFVFIYTYTYTIFIFYILYTCIYLCTYTWSFLPRKVDVSSCVLRVVENGEREEKRQLGPWRWCVCKCNVLCPYERVVTRLSFTYTKKSSSTSLTVWGLGYISGKLNGQAWTCYLRSNKTKKKGEKKNKTTGIGFGFWCRKK